MTPNMIEVLKKRVYDVAAVIDKSVKVKIKVEYKNEALPDWQLINFKTFQQYANLYSESEMVVYEKASDRWEYVVGLTPTDKFCQISFVNGINTYNGGKHVDVWFKQFKTKMIKFIELKKKIKVSEGLIKDQILLVLRCDINKPSFDTQTKDSLNTLEKDFGSTFEISDKFIEKCAIKLEIMEKCCYLMENKDKKKISKSD
jgi:DNA topoisomerase-2